MSYDGQKNITFRHLEIVYYLMEDQNFSRAAGRMYLSQPALTKQVQNLERILGCRVLIRHGRGISLTDEGRILYAYARKILKLRDEAKDKLSRLGSNQQGDIYIGASTIPATYIVPKILSELKKSHPLITAHVKNGDSEDIIAAVVNGEIDMGIVGKNPGINKIHAEPLWPDRLVLIAPVGHPWHEKNDPTLSSLLDEPFIIRERGSAQREIMEEALKNMGVSSLGLLNISAEMGSTEAVKEAVMSGLGISIVSLFGVTRELERGLLTILTLPDLKIDRFLYLIHRKSNPLCVRLGLLADRIRSYRPGSALPVKGETLSMERPFDD